MQSSPLPILLLFTVCCDCDCGRGCDCGVGIPTLGLVGDRDELDCVPLLTTNDVDNDDNELEEEADDDGDKNEEEEVITAAAITGVTSKATPSGTSLDIRPLIAGVTCTDDDNDDGVTMDGTGDTVMLVTAGAAAVNIGRLVNGTGIPVIPGIPAAAAAAATADDGGVVVRNVCDI